MANLWVKKTLSSLQQEAGDEGNPLKRTLTATSLTMIGIGAIIGAGLFSITGTAAAHNAGPAVSISFIIGAVGCLFAGLCYAEFASMIPVAGSAYTYSYATLGELLAWIIGWDLVLEYAVGAATVSISWSRYLVKFFENMGIELSPAWTLSPFDSVTMADGSVVSGVLNLPAVLIVGLTTLLLIRGTKGSAMVTTFIVILKVAVVLLFIALGWGYMNPANHNPYFIENTGNFGDFGWSGIVRGAGIIFFAYIGFDAVSTAAEETIDPQKNLPIGIIGSLIICTVIYIVIADIIINIYPFIIIVNNYFYFFAHFKSYC